MGELARDLRFAVRALRSMRGAAVVAILTLSLGIGATTTMFSVVYAALFRPLPFPEPDRLVMLFTTQTTARHGTERLRWSYAEITALSSRMTTLERIGAYSRSSLAIDTRQSAAEPPNPEQTDGEFVSAGYFDTLGVTAQLGRVFRPEEDRAGAEPVAVLGAGLWRRRFGSDPAVVGRSITVSRQPLTIVGVMPDGFAGLTGRADFWIPTPWAAQLSYRDYLTTPQHFISVAARLKAGVSIGQARAEIVRVAPDVVADDRKSDGDRPSWSADVWPLSRARVDATVERSALLLLAAVGCVLLIACVNVASVLLARAGGRAREVAIRMAVGSSRARLVRLLLTESLLLAAVAGALGTLLAVWGIDLLNMPAVTPSGRNLYGQLSTFSRPSADIVALLFAIVVTGVTTVAFGIVPALEASKTDLVAALKEGGPASGGRRRRMLSALVVSEVALAVLLLACAGLLIETFAQLQQRRSGFVPDGVVSFWVSPPVSRYPVADGPAIVERVLTRIQQVPGVASAAVNRCTPFLGSSRSIAFFPGRDPDPGRAPAVGRHYVSADYFKTLGIPVRLGRALTDDDRAGRPNVTVINDTAARRFWPGRNPIGQRVWFGSTTGFTSPADAAEVVGVVGDVQYAPVEDPVGADFYTSYLQFSYPDTMVMVKAGRDPAALASSLRAAVASIDPGLPIYDVQMIDDRIDGALARPRFNAALVALFAGAAVLLAAVGVFGITSYSVSSRSREIGLRLALGASRRVVVGLVLGHAARLAGLGAAAGLLLAFGATRIMRSVLVSVDPADPITYAAVAATMVGVALAAAFLPARRASSVDPMIVLRSE